MYVAKNLIDLVVLTMFYEKVQLCDKSRMARDIGHFRLSPTLNNFHFSSWPRSPSIILI